MKKLLSLIASIVLLTSLTVLAKSDGNAAAKPAKAKPLTEKGKIEKMDATAGTLTVAGKDFKMDAKAKVSLGGEKKTAADLAVDTEVTVTYADKDGVFVATSVSDGVKKPKDPKAASSVEACSATPTAPAAPDAPAEPAAN